MADGEKLNARKFINGNQSQNYVNTRQPIVAPSLMLEVL